MKHTDFDNIDNIDNLDDYEDDIIMRYTVVKGLDDDVYFSIYGVDAVCTVMEIGKCLSPLVFNATVTGKELLELFRFINEENRAQINPENRYELTAFDD